MFPLSPTLMNTQKWLKEFKTVLNSPLLVFLNGIFLGLLPFVNNQAINPVLPLWGKWQLFGRPPVGPNILLSRFSTDQYQPINRWYWERGFVVLFPISKLQPFSCNWFKSSLQVEFNNQQLL
jgi:hypothetical protein